MVYRNERVVFRFLALTKDMVANLREFQEGVDSRSSYNHPGYVTGTFLLQEGESYEWIESFIAKHGIREEEYDIFVSLSTDSDSEIVDVPAFAMALSRKVGGGMTFSFTVLSES